MSDLTIKVENISKIYKLYKKPIDRLKETLHPLRKKYHQDFYALENISFKVNRGETIGIIGQNGAGKSTLLKILTGVLSQSLGEYFINGKVSSLLELGVGFNPELTGLENIYFNGTILGYSKEEIEQKLDSILEFADIGEFINQPVKTYSSGMVVRLGFAVAINVDPDILIVDEALSVGDIRFQQKCYRRFREFKKDNKTIIFVTHDTGAVINFCDRALWIDKGKIVLDSDPSTVCREYLAKMAFNANTIKKKSKESSDNKQTIKWDEISNCSSFGERGMEIKKVGLFYEETNQSIRSFKGGENVVFSLEVEVKKDIYRPLFGFVVNDSYGNHIFGLNNHILGQDYDLVQAGERIIVEFRFKFPLLKEGQYTFSPAAAEGTQDNHIHHHWVHDAYVLKVTNSNESSKMGWYLLIDDATVKISK